MGRHDAPASTLEAIVADYARQRARELIRQFDNSVCGTAADYAALDRDAWIGAAAEILRELTRDV
jgi:hypothetical protein